LNLKAAHAHRCRFRRFEHLGLRPRDRRAVSPRCPLDRRHGARTGFELQRDRGGPQRRTTVFDDPIEPGRRGADYLPPCLLSHAPLDLLVIALGCNDLKARFSASPGDSAFGAERLILMARAEPVGPRDAPPKILLVAPPPLATLTGFAEMFEGATEKSRLIGARYREVAKLNGVGFVDAGAFIACSPLDGIHYAPDQHAILGRAIAEAARMTLA
jgi:lysophospholipase L1-like esterase